MPLHYLPSTTLPIRCLCFRFIHRDIKPANILLDTRIFHAKIADLGITRFTSGTHLKTIAQGTPAYMAPELWKRDGLAKATEKADVYALGIVLLECITGTKPYDPVVGGTILPGVNAPQQGMLSMMRKGIGALMFTQNGAGSHRGAKLLDACPQELKALIAECIATNYKKRPTAAEVVHRLGEMQALPWAQETGVHGLESTAHKRRYKDMKGAAQGV